MSITSSSSKENTLLAHGTRSDGLKDMFWGFYPVMVKEWIEIFKDRFTLMIMLAVPLVQILIYGYGVSYDVRNIDTVIFDLDRRPASQKIIDKLMATKYFRIKGHVYSRQAITRDIIAGRARVGIIVPPDFSDKVDQGFPAQMQVLIDGSDSTVANAIQSAVVAVGLNQSIHYLTASPEEKPVRLPIEMRPRMLFNPDGRTMNFMLPAVVAYMAQTITLFLTVSSIVREREAGTLEQLLVTPCSPLGLMIGKLIPYAVIAFVGTNLMLLSMYAVFQVPIHGNLLLLEFCMAIFLLVSLSIGLFISASSKNSAQATQIVMFTIVPSILLSGFIFPRETMPLLLNWLGYLLPLTHFLQIQRGIILRGAGIEELWIWIVTLSLFGVLLIYLSVRKFKAALG